MNISSRAKGFVLVAGAAAVGATIVANGLEIGAAPRRGSRRGTC